MNSPKSRRGRPRLHPQIKEASAIPFFEEGPPLVGFSPSESSTANIVKPVLRKYSKATAELSTENDRQESVGNQPTNSSNGFTSERHDPPNMAGCAEVEPQQRRKPGRRGRKRRVIWESDDDSVVGKNAAIDVDNRDLLPPDATQDRGIFRKSDSGRPLRASFCNALVKMTYQQQQQHHHQQLLYLDGDKGGDEGDDNDDDDECKKSKRQKAGRLPLKQVAKVVVHDLKQLPAGDQIRMLFDRANEQYVRARKASANSSDNPSQENLLMTAFGELHDLHQLHDMSGSSGDTLKQERALNFLLNDHRSRCGRCDAKLNSLGIAAQTIEPENCSVVGPAASRFLSPSSYDDLPSREKLIEAHLKNEDLLRTQIRRLEDIITVLTRQKSEYDAQREDLVKMLDGVPEPEPNDINLKYVMCHGFRILDLRILDTALVSAQTCKHASLKLVEMYPDMHVQEGLATRLAFICGTCGPKIVFPSSPFSAVHPLNYSVNKQLLPLLGPTAYLNLSKYVQRLPDPTDFIVPVQRRAKPKMVLSLDRAIYNFARPFDPPPPEDPNANISNPNVEKVDSVPDNQLTAKFHLKNLSTLMPTGVAVRPAEPTQPELLPARAVNATSNKPNAQVQKIKPCPELPAGAKLLSIKSGTKIVSSNVVNLKSSYCGLVPGVYKVNMPNNEPEKILVVSADGAADNQCLSVPFTVGHVRSQSEPDQASAKSVEQDSSDEDRMITNFEPPTALPGSPRPIPSLAPADHTARKEGSAADDQLSIEANSSSAELSSSSSKHVDTDLPGPNASAAAKVNGHRNTDEASIDETCRSPGHPSTDAPLALAGRSEASPPAGHSDLSCNEIMDGKCDGDDADPLS